jgi:hypothetical protein
LQIKELQQQSGFRLCQPPEKPVNEAMPDILSIIPLMVPFFILLVVRLPFFDGLDSLLFIASDRLYAGQVL